LFGIAFVLPGVCAGFISGRRGFLVGALVGLVGSFLYGALFELMQVHSGAVKFRWAAVLIAPAISGISLIIISAVSGGAGELLRSNNRWRVP
jgi:uncharacterized membrane protein YeaQ/YmgE (transglycosylase-associated protein family)